MSRVISLNLDLSERYKKFEIIQVNTKREIQLKGVLLSNRYLSTHSLSLENQVVQVTTVKLKTLSYVYVRCNVSII